MTQRESKAIMLTPARCAEPALSQDILAMNLNFADIRLFALSLRDWTLSWPSAKAAEPHKKLTHNFILHNNLSR